MILPTTTPIGEVPMLDTMPGLSVELDSCGTVRIRQSNVSLLLDVSQCRPLGALLMGVAIDAEGRR